MIDKKQNLGMLAAFTANLIFGFSFVFSKLALTAAHPLIILAARFTLAFIAMNLLIITGRVKINLKGKRKLKLAAMGIAQPLLYFVFEMYGLSLVSSALSGVILALVPVVVMLLAVVFLSERPTVVQIICTIISISGVTVISIISNDGGKNYFKGILLLIAAAVTSSVFNILSRSEAAVFTAFERTYIMLLIGCIGFNFIALFTLRAEFLPELINAVSNINFIIAVFYLSVISSVAAFMLYNYSTSQLSAVRCSSFSNIITVISVLAGVLILKESFSPLEFLICAVIIGGVYGVNRQKT